jgi:hypothetical protein
MRKCGNAEMNTTSNLPPSNWNLLPPPFSRLPPRFSPLFPALKKLNILVKKMLKILVLIKYLPYLYDIIYIGNLKNKTCQRMKK